jgi:hypothetical protein
MSRSVPQPLAIVPAFLLFAASALAAQTPTNHLADPLEITVSGAAVVLGSKLRVDGETMTGTEIDAEQVLGLPNTRVQPRMAVAWRPGRRHELEVGYQFVRREGQKTLTQDFVFRDSTYRAGLAVKSKFNSDQLFLNYRYAIRVRDRSEYGVGVGLGALFLDIGLDALAAGASGGRSGSVQYSQERSVIGPTASLGLYGKWRVGGASYLSADLRAIHVSAGEFEATVYEGGVGYRYYVSPKFGFEAGYGLSAIKLGITTTARSGRDITTKVKYSLQNFRLGVVVAP